MKIVKSTIGNTSRTATLGNYIIGSSYLKADPNNEIFLQEYGHYIQSQNMGPFYLLVVGIPSIGSTIFYPSEHKYQDCERDANFRAFHYFDKYIKGFRDDSNYRFGHMRSQKGWNPIQNPLYPENKRINKYNLYYDKNEGQKELPWIYTMFHF